MRSVLVITLLFSISIIGIAQEASGLYAGRYNGLNATKINPAFAFKSEQPWNIQVFGIHAFAETNYAYLPETNVIQTLKNLESIIIPDPDAVISAIPTAGRVQFKTDSETIFADAKLDIRGLGYLFNYRENMKLGFSINARGQLSSLELPSFFNYHTAGNIQLDTTYVIQNFQLNASNWFSLDAHWAYQSKEDHTLGFSARFLIGLDASHIYLDNSLEIGATAQDIIQTNAASNLEFALSGDNDLSRFSGRGWSVDIGYMSPKLDNRDSQFGISLIDLGYIRYNDLRYIAALGFGSVLDISSGSIPIRTSLDLNNWFVDNGINVGNTSSYVVYLPTAIAVQYISNLYSNINMEWNITKSVPLGGTQIQRSDMINMTLLYEKPNFSAFVPVTLYDYDTLRVGAAIRFYYVTIGSDRISNWIYPDNSINGVDVYLNVQFYPFQKKNQSNAAPKSLPCFY